MDQIQEMAVNPSFSLLRGILGIVFSTIGLWSIHWSLVVVVIIEIGILLLLPKFYAKELSKKTVHKTKENERLNQIISDVLLAYDTFNNGNILKKKSIKLLNNWALLEEIIVNLLRK
jgi:ABC transporter, ATP-binding protein